MIELAKKQNTHNSFEIANTEMRIEKLEQKIQKVKFQLESSEDDYKNILCPYEERADMKNTIEMLKEVLKETSKEISIEQKKLKKLKGK